MKDEHETSSHWQLTDKRREALEKSADELKVLVNRNPPPSFDEVQRAVDRIAYEHETTKNK